MVINKKCKCFSDNTNAGNEVSGTISQLPTLTVG